MSKSKIAHEKSAKNGEPMAAPPAKLSKKNLAHAAKLLGCHPKDLEQVVDCIGLAKSNTEASPKREMTDFELAESRWYTPDGQRVVGATYAILHAAHPGGELWKELCDLTDRFINVRKDAIAHGIGTGLVAMCTMAQASWTGMEFQFTVAQALTNLAEEAFQLRLNQQIAKGKQTAAPTASA